MVTVKYPFSVSFSDYPDNHSHAVVVYFLGCDHYCKGCHNPELQNNANKPNGLITLHHYELYNEIVRECNKHHTNKVVFSGGDCLSGDNMTTTQAVLSLLKNSYHDVCVYTGYNVEHLITISLCGFKYVKTNKYDINFKQIPSKNDRFMTLASANQCLYDEYFTHIGTGTIYFNEYGDPKYV